MASRAVFEHLDKQGVGVGLDGVVTTIVGTGVASSAGDGGLATAASVNSPLDVLFDASGNLFISEGSGAGVRRVDAATGNSGEER